jgi:putative ABC transport system permease protein
VNEAFDRRGIDLVIIAAGVTDQLSSDIEQGIGEQIRQMPEVAIVDMAIVELVEVPRGQTNISVMMLGWPPMNKGYEDLQILAGRRLAAGDVGKALLGATVAQNLGKGVGDTIPLQGEPFEVVGVYESFSVFENGAVVVLLDEAQRLAARPGRVTGFSVAVNKTTTDPAVEVESVRQKILGSSRSPTRPASRSGCPASRPGTTWRRRRTSS